MNPEEPPLNPFPVQDDKVSKGVWRAITWQVVTIAAAVPIAIFGQWAVVIFFAWSLFQWLALVPQYFWFKKKSYPLAATGVLIMGGLGVLLNAGCYGLTMAILNGMSP
jgi:hypothetical protein